MRNTRIRIITLLIVVNLFLIGKFIQTEEGDYSKQLTFFSSENIQIQTEGYFLFEEPRMEVTHNELVLSEELPEGVRLFQEHWDLSGRKIDQLNDVSCVIVGDGSIFCWEDTHGAAYAEPDMFSISTLGVVSEGVFTDIAVGGSHFCALARTEAKVQLYCWGQNNMGQLGKASEMESEGFEIAMISNDNWTHISAGETHSCGVVENRRVFCWGEGSVGQLGVGENKGSQSPILVKESNREIEDLQSGKYHSCILFVGGFVECWGWNSYGQIGSGNFEEVLSPIRIKIPRGSTMDLSVGDFHTCVHYRDSDETLCWGDNRMQQIENSEVESLPQPTILSISTPDIQKITTSMDRTCALINSMLVECTNYSAGDNPIKMPLQRPARDIIVLGEKICIIELDGGVYCRNFNSSRLISGLPLGIGSLRISENVLRGTIAGFPKGEFMGDFIIFSGGESEEIGSFGVSIIFGDDSDNDGWSDIEESRCNSHKYDIRQMPIDTDGDLICDRFDEDDDGDGFQDTIDRFPLDATEWRDDDRDGIGRNSEYYEISPGMKSGLVTLGILFTLMFIEVISIRSGYNQTRKRGLDSTEDE